jgi:preprotein translocase subunit SecA
VLINRVRQFVRKELTDLEQFVLIQILDQSWKDHLYAMDQLKGSIGLQAFAEKDPRVLYKKEGYEFFRQMMAGRARQGDGPDLPRPRRRPGAAGAQRV